MTSTWPSRILAAWVVILSLFISGCKDDNAPAPNNTDTAPSKGAVSAVPLQSNQLVIYYRRQDNSYDGWGLHLFDSAGANDLAEGVATDWNNPKRPDGISERYGAYFIIDLNARRNDQQEFQFIVHAGNDKDIGGKNMVYSLKDYGQDAYTVAGYTEVSDTPIMSVPMLAGAAAHLITGNLLVWDVPTGTEKVELLIASQGGLANNSDSTDLDGADRRIVLAADGLLAVGDAELYPYLAGRSRWQLPAGTDLKTLLKGQLAVVAKNQTGRVLQATQVQTGFALDALYFDGSTGLADMPLGAVYSPDGATISIRVWAPTAKSVKLLLTEDSSRSVDSLTPQAMTYDQQTGVWQYSADRTTLDRRFYRYQVKAYRRDTGRVETTTVTDPYSLAVVENGRFTRIVNLNDADLKPQGWDSLSKGNKPADIAVYESHIRDISTFDCGLDYSRAGEQCPAGVNAENNGKYNAFAESTRASMQHLQKLQEAGLTYVQVLPAFDFATVDENPDKVADLTDDFARLCELNPQVSKDSLFAGYCTSGQTIGDVFATIQDNAQAAQALSAYLRPIDSFNWGYDPYHYGAPENSYASKTDGVTAVKEFRGMVKALDDMGLRVVMDVVYNHTNSAGLTDKSVLDKLVPDYYQRLNIDTGAVENSTCCSNTASEMDMMEKLMVDTLKVWARDYKVDAFRFDLMGHHLKRNMARIQSELKAINPNIYLYGEGWEFGEIAGGRIGVSAVQKNMYDTGIGTFTDRLRDAVRGGGPFDGGNSLRENQGFGSGFWGQRNEMNDSVTQDRINSELNNMDIIRLGLVGNLKDFQLVDYQGKTRRGDEINYNGQPAGYTGAPVESVNYVSKHDNQTLWDNLQYKLAAELKPAERVRMQILSLAIPVLSQGVPFIHMGSDILRSKSMERDSYDSGDWYNGVMFNLDDPQWRNNWNQGLPRKDKDGGNWDLISRLVANPNTVVAGKEAKLSAQMFQEYFRIRRSSPLFHLESAAQVSQVVRFHNTGVDQTPGLIAMELDDSKASLDSNYNSLMVLVNATAKEQRLTVAGAQDYRLHPVQQDSVDSTIRQARFSAGAFIVPARSLAVFVR